MDEGADVPISRKIDFQREKMKYTSIDILSFIVNKNCIFVSNSNKYK